MPPTVRTEQSPCSSNLPGPAIRHPSSVSEVPSRRTRSSSSDGPGPHVLAEGAGSSPAQATRRAVALRAPATAYLAAVRLIDDLRRPVGATRVPQKSDTSSVREVGWDGEGPAAWWLRAPCLDVPPGQLVLVSCPIG